MRDRIFGSAVHAALIIAAISTACTGLPAWARAPGCDAVFSVICEDGYGNDVEFTLTEEETGKEVTVLVGKGDGYRRTVSVPPGTYTASALVPDMGKEYEILLDERPQEAEDGGTCNFCALVGSWLYTVENAGLAGIRDDSGAPAYYGVIRSEDAVSYMMAAEGGEPGTAGKEEGPQEIEEKPGEAGTGGGYGPEGAEETTVLQEPAEEQEEKTGSPGISGSLVTVLGIIAVISAGAVFIRHRGR